MQLSILCAVSVSLQESRSELTGLLLPAGYTLCISLPDPLRDPCLIFMISAWSVRSLIGGVLTPHRPPVRSMNDTTFKLPPKVSVQSPYRTGTSLNCRRPPRSLSRLDAGALAGVEKDLPSGDDIGRSTLACASPAEIEHEIDSGGPEDRAVVG